MGICFYWKCHYGDPAVEEAIRDDPSEQQYVWGLDHDSVSVSGLSKFFSGHYEDIHEYFTEAVVLRCWRFDRLYVEFEAEEFTGATLVIRKWMQDIARTDEFQNIKDKVRAFAQRHPKQWDRIDGLCGSHRNTIAATPTFESAIAYDYSRFQELQEFGANILVVENLLLNSHWSEVRKRVDRARKVKVKKVSDGEYVAAGSAGKEYHVDLMKISCSCEDFQKRGRKRGLHCKHLIAALQDADMWQKHWGRYVPRGPV